MILSGIEWTFVEERMPPERTLVMVTGDSGMISGPMGKDRFLTLAYYDEGYRPRRGGPVRWLNVQNNELTDCGLVPEYWAPVVELPR